MTEATTVKVVSQESLVASAAGLVVLPTVDEVEPFGLRKVNAPRIKTPSTAPITKATTMPMMVLRLETVVVTADALLLRAVLSDALPPIGLSV
ncbi:hypothetical protein [Bifidobacterium aerophilum]|uniref:hypothetical protein n=1 Tax=Bifidobacterium aerophilum TaxID=1798155 RepID=UPI001EF7B1C7|nr:hypothetical protein [Bifidobacterium aerophilum]